MILILNSRVLPPLCNLLDARLEGGRRVAGIDPELRRERDLQLPGAVLGVDAPNVDAHRFHRRLHGVREVGNLRMLQRGEYLGSDAECRHAPVVRPGYAELELAGGKQLQAVVLAQFHQHSPRARPGERRVQVEQGLSSGVSSSTSSSTKS